MNYLSAALIISFLCFYLKVMKKHKKKKKRKKTTTRCHRSESAEFKLKEYQNGSEPDAVGKNREGTSPTSKLEKTLKILWKL